MIIIQEVFCYDIDGKYITFRLIKHGVWIYGENMQNVIYPSTIELSTRSIRVSGEDSKLVINCILEDGLLDDIAEELLKFDENVNANFTNGRKQDHKICKTL